MNKFISFFSILFILHVISCENAPMDLFVEQGEKTMVSRSLPFFDIIEIEDVFDVYLVNDSVFKVEIMTGENIIPEISTEVKDSILFIRNDIGARWSREYIKPVLYIYFPGLRRLYLQEPSNLYTLDTLRCENLIVYALADLQLVDITVKTWNFQLRSSHTASGVYTIKGWTWNSYLSAYGGCTVNAGELETRYTHFVNHSIGDFTVNVVKSLEGEIFNTGNVFYTGSPENLDIESYSSGRAIKLK